MLGSLAFYPSVFVTSFVLQADAEEKPARGNRPWRVSVRSLYTLFVISSIKSTNSLIPASFGEFYLSSSLMMISARYFSSLAKYQLLCFISLPVCLGVSIIEMKLNTTLTQNDTFDLQRRCILLHIFFLYRVQLTGKNRS